MSMTTHRFHSVQTLARAQEWLGQIGITPDRIEVSSTGLPSMTGQTDFSRMPEVEIVITAAERPDPEGWPAYDPPGALPPIQIAAAPPAESHEPLHTSPIGWHP